jgi:heat shock protein 5
MARTSGRGAAKPFAAWTTIFYLLLVFIAPLAFFGSAHAQDDDSSVQENYGTVIGIDLGTTYSYVVCSNPQDLGTGT